MKFDEEMKDRLIKLRNDGLGNKRLAKELGVSTSTIVLWLRKIGLGGMLEEYKEVTPEKKCIITCMKCGNETKTRYKTTKFCSDKCRTSYNKKHKGHKKKCNHCHNSFLSYKDKKYCSGKCWESHLLSVKAEKQIKTDALRKEKEVVKLINCLGNIISRAKLCSHCGKEYILQKNINSHKYCSDECKEEGYRITRRKHKRKNRLNKDKRWATNGKIDYSITLDKLHKRDEGICYLCNEPTDYNDFVITDMNVFIAGNNYPSIDHVLPIAKGGLHSWNNIKLAHRICNSIKKDKLIIKV